MDKARAAAEAPKPKMMPAVTAGVGGANAFGIMPPAPAAAAAPAQRYAKENALKDARPTESENMPAAKKLQEQLAEVEESKKSTDALRKLDAKSGAKAEKAGEDRATERFGRREAGKA